MKLIATFRDARANIIDTVEGEAADVIAQIANFVLLHGTDPDENGKDAAPGTVSFVPVKGD